MPPFKDGLQKRKHTDQKKDKELANKNNEVVSELEEETEDLLGEINDDGDSTDSEHNDEIEANSDTERDEVVFDEQYDSTLEDDEGEESDASSELTDSESDDESEEEDSDEDKSDPDSGIEQANNERSTEPSEPTSTSKPKTKQTSLVPVQQKDEYESGDTSDEEGHVNTAGDVPMWWYNEYQHIGYDVDGKRIIKPPQRDQIDDFLKKCSDPEFWRTVRDPRTGQDVVLSAADLRLIAAVRSGQTPLVQGDTYEPWVEWFTREVLATPVRAFPEHKRSFLPPRDEQRAVARIVHALKMGWAKTRKQLAEERRARKERKWYNLWGTDAAPRGLQRHIAAPRRAPPSHAESYNPPPEYLLDAKELKEWNKLEETPWKRKYTFLPTQYSSLRQVPAYPRYVRERFLRCLDLYLAPRAIKMRLTISPEDLVPKLPSPRDLQPFPTREALCFRGHAHVVRSVDFDPSGQYAVSGSDDCSLKVWETATGRCLRTVALEEPVRHVAWSPAAGLTLVACAVGARVLLVNPGGDIGAHRAARSTDELLAEPPPQHDVTPDARTQACCAWEAPAPAQWARGVRVSVSHFKPVLHVAWHSRGDYLVATLQDAQSRSVAVHQLSRRRSQLPFRRAPGLVSMALFHPTRPLLFVATQRVVRVYDLVKQVQVRKLLSGAQWISHMALHPAGDNLLLATYDRKCVWFDLELSSKPYQTLRVHGAAARGVAFSARYPLFASAGDDGRVVVSHGMVYNDLLQNPLLVPLKQLPAPPSPHAPLRTLALRWHPAQPWLLAACADHTLRLYA